MTTNSPLVFEQAYPVRSYEPRTDGRVSIASICNHLQDIASCHADALGFGYHDMECTGHFWLLARLHVMLDRLPRFGETDRVTTWPSGNERLTASRDFTLQVDGQPIGRATSSWVSMNIDTRRPTPPGEVLQERFIPDRGRALRFPSKAVTRLREGDHEILLMARRSDLDVNDHVNNVRYVEFGLEAVPPEWMAARRCLGVDIQFRSESFAGDEYRATCAQAEREAGLDTMLHGLMRTADNREIARMKTWWQSK